MTSGQPHFTLGAVLVALAVLTALVVLAAAHVVYWRRRFYVAADYDQLRMLTTEDGCTIVLRRLPRPDGDIVGPPVLMVHGLCANHRNNDLVPDHSIARYRGGRVRASASITWSSTTSRSRFARCYARPGRATSTTSATPWVAC